MSASSTLNEPAGTSPAWRDALLALVVALLCYGLSCVIVAPGHEAHGFGIDWQAMSEAPFELRGRLPHRILAPLLAHASGLGGANFLLFVRGLCVLLLGTVFFFCRRRGANAIDASLVTLAVAVTSPTQIYKIHWVGYPDALCYALFFGNLLASKRPVMFWTLFFVNLTNHELAAFLLPWLWFLRRQANGSVRADVAGAGITLALYGAFYFWVKAAAPAQVFSDAYFTAHPLFPGGTVVVLALALTHFVVAFGPILAVLSWHQRQGAARAERWHLWLVLGGIVAIFCIAFDWARHTNLIVLPFVIASLRFLQAGHRAVYAALVAAGVALMLCVTPWPAKSWPTHVLFDPSLTTGMVVVNVAPDAGHLDITFGSLGTALTAWLPEVWPMLTALATILAVIWLAGWWFARWTERRVLRRD